jgi:hypothetical protein
MDTNTLEYARTWLSTTQHVVSSRTRLDGVRAFPWRVRTLCKRTLNPAKVQAQPFAGDTLCHTCRYRQDDLDDTARADS